MPSVESILVETLDPEGPYGAKECGQGPLLPVIPAVAIAVHDALGVCALTKARCRPDKIISSGSKGRLSSPTVPDFDFPPHRSKCLAYGGRTKEPHHDEAASVPIPRAEDGARSGSHARGPRER